MNDLVSIIVPVYHAERFIEETLDSVRAQTYVLWELLLVVDGAQDPTIPVIEAYMERTGDERIRMFVQPENRGAAHARNRALKEATGRYISYVDADDIWKKDKLAKELSVMFEKDAAFVFSGYEFADEMGRGTGKVVRVKESMHLTDALKNTTIFTSTVIFDTEKIDKDFLEMPIMKSEDTALWWKVLAAGYTAYGVDEPLVYYRRPAKSLSSNKVEAVRRIWNLYRKAAGLNVIQSAYYFCFWAVTAVYRRL